MRGSCVETACAKPGAHFCHFLAEVQAQDPGDSRRRMERVRVRASGAAYLSDRVVRAGVVGAPALRRGAYRRELVPRERPIKVCRATVNERRGLPGAGGCRRGVLERQRHRRTKALGASEDALFKERSHPNHGTFTASRFLVKPGG
jgi:hypothetical protein